MDISENGWQIAEKLSALLDEKQWQELAEYMFSRVEQIKHRDECLCAAHFESTSLQYGDQPLTEVREGALYFCPELRKVCIGDTEIELTVKEYDAFHLLISNRHRILTFEVLAYQIWGEEYVDLTAKTIHNLMSRLRQKLQISPDTPKYIVCVRSVGYKFDAEA